MCLPTGGAGRVSLLERNLQLASLLRLSLGLLASLGLLLRLLRLSGGLGLGGLSAVVLGHGLDDGLLLLGLEDGDGVGESLLGAGLALGVGAAHDLDLDAENTLAEEDVAGGVVDEVLGGLTRVDHEAVGELHGLGASSTELAGDDDLATLGAGLHDEAEDTVAGATDGETVEELVAEGLALGDGGETAVLDLGGVEGDGVLGELEALLDERGELADAAALLAENLLGVGGADDDVGYRGGDADLDAGIALLGQLALEELVELSVEDAIGDELSALGAIWGKKDESSAKTVPPNVHLFSSQHSHPAEHFHPSGGIRNWRNLGDRREGGISRKCCRGKATIGNRGRTILTSECLEQPS